MRSGSIIAIIGAVLLVFLLVALVGGGPIGWGMMGPGHMWGWDGNSFGFGWGLAMLLFMGLLPILFLVAVVLGIVWLVRSSPAGEAGRDDGEDRSMSIVRERYARGEITKEEFEQLRQDLE